MPSPCSLPEQCSGLQLRDWPCGHSGSSGFCDCHKRRAISSSQCSYATARADKQPRRRDFRAACACKSMLEHSRGSSGERRSVDLNGLIEEALNLAYHGGRAQDASFNITLERDFAKAIAPIEL